jgi:TonB family protein
VKKTLLAFALMLLPGSALAQLSALPPGASPPAPTGPIHVCNYRNYPREAVAQHAQGDADVGFTITADGSVADITILKSSGNDALDQASIACVAPWHYVPATLNGKPIAVGWKAHTQWRMKGMGVNPMPTSIPADAVRSPAERDTHDCSHGHNSDGATPGKVILSYTIKADGTVAGVTVKSSSGDAAFDSYAATCVTSWYYKPAERAGAAVDFPWGTEITWRP